jgi:hypothetical protein
MFTVDLQAAETKTQKYFSDMSFSFLTWRNIERLESKEISIEKLDDDTVLELVFSILPGGDTIFHRLLNLNEVETLDYIAGVVLADTNLSFPYVRNLENKCPIAYALEKNQYKFINVLIKYLSEMEIDHHSRYIADFLPDILALDLSNFAAYIQSRGQ